MAEEEIKGNGFIGLLTLLFIGLKLTGHINWSWWWVLSPIWITVILVILLIIFGAIFMALYDSWREKNKKSEGVEE